MRRKDGKCPTCKDRPKQPGYSYCRPCNTSRERSLRHARAAAAGKPVKRGPWPRMTFEALKPALLLLAEGVAPKQIAHRTGVAPKTFWYHLRWLRRYAKVRTDCQLCVWAVRNGHVPMEAPLSATSNTSTNRTVAQSSEVRQ